MASYNYVKNLTRVNRTVKSARDIKYIVIHYTGNNTDTAKANANYFKNINRNASAHYFVDEENVYQVVNDKDVAWAVGKNYGNNNLFGIVTNDNSISIEMCSKNGRIADKTFNNTVELARQLMKKYGIATSNVVRHFDVCSKKCPGWSGWGTGIGGSEIWQNFKKAISSSNVTIKYKGHCQTLGDTATVKNGEVCGTTGRALRLEALSIVGLDNAPGVGIAGQAHVQGIGWQGQVIFNGSNYIGTKGKALRMEAIKLSLCGNNASKYILKYRVHMQGIGWGNWTTNGTIAGTTGQKRRIEAVQIIIEKK